MHATARATRLVWLAGAGIVTATVAAILAWLFWPRVLPMPSAAQFPQVDIADSRVVLKPSGGTIVGTVATSSDELRAYLDFEYVKTLPPVRGSRVMLAATETDNGPVYRVYVALPGDLLSAWPVLSGLKSRKLVAGYGLSIVPPEELEKLDWQTQLFLWAYNLPLVTRLDELHPAEVLPAMARFILFKSETDRRVREGFAMGPAPLSLQQASTLAADIIVVAGFYDLPLEFFLGIGAMENNYMSAMGDLEHAVWKKKAERGDIVLKRRRGRVLVRNYSIGVWQITRETLRYAHRLYLKDRRDYSALPERLRPGTDLDLDMVNQDVLTTYAGLLFRDLLDHFEGDVERAVAAYNGGVGNPNLRYAAGVAGVAGYARNLLEHAAARDGRGVMPTAFLAAPDVSSNAIAQ